MENPATASWGLSLSDQDFAALKGGCKIRDMDDKWAFIARTDQELLDELSAKETATTYEKPTEDIMSDEELVEELEMVEEEEEEERTEKARPARVVTEEDMAQGGNISIRRTWTNTEFYRLILTVQPSEGGFSRKVEAITWEQRQGGVVSQEQAKVDVVLLCRSHLDCDLAAAPDYETEQFSALQSTPVAADSTA